MSLYVSSS